MSIYDLPPVAALLSGAHALVESFIAVLTPLVASAAPLVAIVLVTLAVRALLVPLGLRAARGDLGRRALAPRVAELRRRHSTDAARLSRELTELYRREQVSPFGALLPLLAQAPVLSVLYGLFSRAVIAGAPNLLLAHQLAGMPLSGALLPALLSGTVTWPAVVVPLAVLGAIALSAELARRRAERLRIEDGLAEPPRAVRVLGGVLPFVGVVIAAVVPLAAAVYLATSALWGVLERPALARLAAR